MRSRHPRTHTLNKRSKYDELPAYWRKHFRRELLRPLVFLLIAGMGIYFLASSHAASYVGSQEAENGTVAGGASVVSDSSASGGKAVKFGSASTGGGGSGGGGITFNTCISPTTTIPMDPNNVQAGVTIGNFYLTDDTWNAGGYQVSQTIYACDYNDWYVIANMNNNANDGAVKTYPNIHEDFNEPKISSYHTISSTFAETAPHVGIYEYAYDMWLNGVASNGSTEVMIWNDNYGQTPSGSVVATFSDGGQTYNVYKSGSYIAFVDTTNVMSGTINILDFYNFIISKGYIASTSTIGQIDYGIEMVSTSSTNAKFEVNNFSLTAN